MAMTGEGSERAGAGEASQVLARQPGPPKAVRARPKRRPSATARRPGSGVVVPGPRRRGNPKTCVLAGVQRNMGDSGVNAYVADMARAELGVGGDHGL